MDDLVKQLIKCEQDAKETINHAILEKDEMKEKAIEEANSELNELRINYDLKISEMKERDSIYLKDLEKVLNQEYEEIKKSYINKDNSSIEEEILNIICGYNEN